MTVIGYVVIDWGHVSGQRRVVGGLIFKTGTRAQQDCADMNRNLGGYGEPNRFTVAEVREIEKPA